MAIEEAQLEDVGSGLAPVSPGWFVVSAAEAAWVRNEGLSSEEQERERRAWDFVHCPPGTRHACVGTGDQPCVILMTGARPEGRTIHYPSSDAARAHGAGVETETDSPEEAYASLPSWRVSSERWTELPWVSTPTAG